MRWIIAIIMVLAMAQEAAALETGVVESALPDGAKIRCYYGEKGAGGGIYAGEVLENARKAYIILTQVCGFSRNGYSFIVPDISYAYDHDRTIDIFITDTGTAYFEPRSSDGNPNAYNAVILIPEDI